MPQQPDTVVRRIVVEYGRLYVYLRMTDANDRTVADYEEVFTQPFPLDRKDATEESTDCWQHLYQWCLDTVVFATPEKDTNPNAQEDK